MKKARVFLSIIILIIILSGCNNPKTEEVDPLLEKTNLPKIEEVEDQSQISPPDLTSEEGIREYLQGQWIFNKDYTSDSDCKMHIDEDLNLKLEFTDPLDDKLKLEYEGQISFSKIYAGDDDAPDIITFELEEMEFSEGDFYFLHRTTYDGKHAMSLFYSGNGTSIFDVYLTEKDSGFTLDELIFEKECGQFSKLQPLKDEKFHAVFWDKGEDGEIWIDDVISTPLEEQEEASIYPYAMTLYENDIKESILYRIKEDRIRDILGDDLFPGQVYYVETDKQGNIIEFISPEYKKFLEESAEDYVEAEEDYEDGGEEYENGGEEYNDYTLEDQIYHILTEIVEVQEYIDQGMSILFDGETIKIDGQECYLIALGTDHEESFVREIHYGINVNTEQVYRLDVLDDLWEPLGVG